MSEWYLKRGEKEIGPIDSKQLRQMAAQNKVRPTDYIRQGADGKWTTVSHVKGLFADSAPLSPSAPTPIAVQGGDTPVPPSASTPQAFGSVPPFQMPTAPPVATPTASSMSFGDGLGGMPENSSKTSSPKKGKKGKKKASAPMDQKTVIIASVAGGAVLLLIAIVVLVFALRGNKDSGKPAPDADKAAQTQTEDKDAQKPATEENANPEGAPAEDGAPAEENANANDAAIEEDQPSQPIEPPKNAIDSSTQSAKVGDLEIKVVSIKQGVETITKSDGAEAESPERSTIITLSIQNINPNKKVKFTPWSVQLTSGKKTNITLTDSQNVYGCALKPGEVPKGVERKTDELYSDDPPVKDVLVFKRIVAGAKELFLTLPEPGDPTRTIVFSIKTDNMGSASGAAKTEKAADESDSAPNADNANDAQTPAEDFNPENDDEYSEIDGVSEAAQKRDQAEADAELKSLNLGD